MRFSILVVTYNPDPKKLLFTLKSVMLQRFRDFEVVISDDGSEDNLFSLIRDYFKTWNFTEYTLVPHEKNQGTVKNLIDALKAARGDYVRDFGPGDAFYSRDTLGQLDRYLVRHPEDLLFGLIRGYRNTETGIKTADFCHPFDIQAYRKKNAYQRILRNLVLYGDNPSGASFLTRREVYLSYLQRISDEVTYEEDLFTVLAALEGKTMRLYDRYMIWYESDAGVSTAKKSSFSELLRKDVQRFYERIFREYGDVPCVKKRKQVEPFFRFRNLYVRTFFRSFVNPGAINYVIASMLERALGCHRDKIRQPGFLDDPAYLEEIYGNQKDCI